MCNPDQSSKSLPALNSHEKVSTRSQHSTRSTLAQVLVTCIQNWLLIDIGLEISISTVVIGALHRNTAETLSFNDDQASWFGSIPSFCHPLGSLTSGFFQEKLGRKGSMVLINIPILAAWLVLAFANSVNAFYISAVIMGLTIGLSEAPLHSYIGEIAEPRLRGSLSTFSTSACSIGILLMYIIGYLFEWRTVALICCVFPVITFFLMTQIPESPTWLLVRSRFEDAKKSLSWLRGWVRPDEVEEEFQDLVSYTKDSAQKNRARSGGVLQSSDEELPATNGGYALSELKRLTSKKVLLPLRMVFIVFAVCSMAGVAGLRPYLIRELNDLGTPINSKLVLIMSQLLFFVGAMVNVAFLRRFGKRKIALFAYGVAGACTLGIGAYSSFLQPCSKEYPILVWVPLALILFSTFLFGLGIAPLPWQFVCEVFPPGGRGTATGLAAAFSHFLHFAHIKSFLYIEAWLTFSGVMYLYAVGTAVGVLYLYFHLPETEGKTLEQIESYFTENHDPKEKFSIGKSKQIHNPEAAS